MGSQLLEALRGVEPRLPAALDVFDSVVVTGRDDPDFYEHSVRVGDAPGPFRLTYYFDVHRRGPAVAREAGARFLRFSADLGIPLPPALGAFVSSDAATRDEVKQVVLGIDAPPGGELRAKYYLVFRRSPGSTVRELLRSLALAPAAGADPDKVVIVGCDATAAGLDDVKLYFRVEPRKVPAMLDDASEIAGLLTDSHEAVYQQCTLRPSRRQLYLHARSPALRQWLGVHGFTEALGRARGIDAHLQGARLEPRIVSFAYDSRRLALGNANVYFHLIPTRGKRP